jgi:hypothetical protein
MLQKRWDFKNEADGQQECRTPSSTITLLQIVVVEEGLEVLLDVLFRVCYMMLRRQRGPQTVLQLCFHGSGENIFFIFDVIKHTWYQY